MAVEAPQLISRSCTTGWFDWVWGDLWLTEDALFRISRGKPATREAARARKRAGSRSTVADIDAIDVKSPEVLNDELPSNDKNRHVVLSEIQTARLRRGLLNDRLSVALNDGTRIKLLWLKDDPAHEILAARLEDRLGTKLTLR